MLYVYSVAVVCLYVYLLLRYLLGSADDPEQQSGAQHCCCFLTNPSRSAGSLFLLVTEDSRVWRSLSGSGSRQDVAMETRGLFIHKCHRSETFLQLFKEALVVFRFLLLVKSQVL